MINADKLGKRAATRSDAEFAAEEARLLDELLASADLSSPTVPEIRSADQTSDTEASHDQVTWQAPAPAPEQLMEQAATVSPSAYSAPESASPTPTDATTMISGDELRELEELHQAWTLVDTEPVAEEAKPVDEPPASPELGLPTVPALLPGDQTIDAVTSQDRGFWQASVPAPEQPVEQAVSPSAYGAPESAVPTVTDTATTINDDELRELEEPHRTWTLGDAELDAEEAKPVDEPPAPAELSSPAALEALPGDQTTDAETPQDLGTWQVPVPAPEQPVEQAVTVSPSAYSAPESAVPTVTDTATTINDDELRELEELHRTWTLGDAELDAEEAKPVDEPPAPAELSSPAALEAPPGDQTTDAVTPQDLGTIQAPVPAPEQPEPEAATPSPSAYGTPESAIPTVTDTATTINDDELRELEELHRTWTLGDAELDAEEAKPVDEPPAPAELSSAAALEAPPGDQTTDAETPQDLGTIQAPAPRPEQPEAEAATPSPSAYGTPTPRSPRTQPRRRSMPTSLPSPTHRIGSGTSVISRPSPSKRSRLTSLLPLLSSARPARSRFYRVIRRPMPRRLKTWARARRRCRFPSSPWNRRRRCRRPLTSHRLLMSPSPQLRERSMPTSLTNSPHAIGPGTFAISRPPPSKRSRLTSLRPLRSSARPACPRFYRVIRRPMARRLKT